MNENNVRTLDFSGDDKQIMPEDVFEGGAPEAFTPEELAAAEPQFTDAEVYAMPVPEEPSKAVVTTHKSDTFFVIDVPSLGVEFAIDVASALDLFDSLGAAINGL